MIAPIPVQLSCRAGPTGPLGPAIEFRRWRTEGSSRAAPNSLSFVLLVRSVRLFVRRVASSGCLERPFSDCRRWMSRRFGPDGGHGAGRQWFLRAVLAVRVISFGRKVRHESSTFRRNRFARFPRADRTWGSCIVLLFLGESQLMVRSLKTPSKRCKRKSRGFERYCAI